MVYSRALGENRLYKYQNLFYTVDLLSAGKKELFDYPTPEEAKAAREALYNYWKIQKRTPFFKIEFVGRAKKTFCVTNNFPEDKLPLLGVEPIEDLIKTYKKALLDGTYTIDEQQTIMSFLRKTKTISIDTYSKIDVFLKENEKQQAEHFKDQTMQQELRELFSDKEEKEEEETKENPSFTPSPTLDLSLEELHQRDLEWEATCVETRKEKAEILALAKLYYPEKFDPPSPKDLPKDSPKKNPKQSLKQILAENAFKYPDKDRPKENPVPDPFPQGESS